MLLLILGSGNLPDAVAQPDKKRENRTASVLEW